MMASSRARRREALTCTTAVAVLAMLGAAPMAVGAQMAPRALSLAEALRLAAGTSEQVALARAAEQRARGQQTQARAALLPQLASTLNWQKQLQNQFAAIASRSGNSGSGTGTGSGSDSSTADNPITRIFASQYNFNVGLTASQPLFTGGRATANIRSARAAREAAAIGITSAEAQVQLDVTSAYYDALLAERLATIADSAFVQAERTLRQVQLTRSVGSASEFELIRARVTRDNQRPSLLQARTQRELAFVRLRQLLDLPAGEPLQLTDSIAEGPAPVPPGPALLTTVNVDAVQVLAPDPRVAGEVSRRVASSDTSARARAAVLQAQKNVEIAQQALRATKAARLPQISAQTNYQRLAYPRNILPTSLNDFLPNWTVGLGLSLPLFTGGNVRGQIVAAEAGVIDARQRLKLAEEGASLDARAATLQLTEAEAAWQASLGTAEQAQRAYEIAEVRFREGISTQLELSETRVQLQQALANRARAARDLQVARKRLALLPYLPLSPSAPLAASTNPGTTR
ncbi:MAG: TolC family protein [Gemmatimonas sp.]|jgi:outer membrane protein|uniref:TolC family protein n=1 Tax=Gemmatimonas sp. TaxID=1962908 RepID=UPI00391FB499|nr:TolC family protein [Gemmatimonadota bacterium]